MEFFDGATSLGAPVALVGSGVASAVDVGVWWWVAHSVTAVFTDGSVTSASSTSPVLIAQTVDLAATSTTVVGSTPNPSVFGQDYVRCR